VTRYDDTFLVSEIFLPKQAVNATTTAFELGDGAQGSFWSEIQKERGIETVNGIRYWGHSHVNMAPNPSGQDDKQLEDWDHCEFVIRAMLQQARRVPRRCLLL